MGLLRSLVECSGTKIWKICCADKEGGLGIRSLVALNKALLGKWSWKFAKEWESLWKQVIFDKFGLEGGGWCSRVGRGGFGVGVWKAIRREWEGIQDRSCFAVGNGKRVKFWKDLWCEDQTLKDVFPTLFLLVVDKEGWVSDAWEESGELGCWSPRFSRHLNDWEMGEVESLYWKLHSLAVRRDVEDALSWRESRTGCFFC